MSGLLICPDCLSNNQRQILGSITPSGGLVIRKFGNAKQEITVQSAEMLIVCTCGYGTVLVAHTTSHYRYTPTS